MLEKYIPGLKKYQKSVRAFEAGTAMVLSLALASQAAGCGENTQSQDNTTYEGELYKITKLTGGDRQKVGEADVFQVTVEPAGWQARDAYHQLAQNDAVNRLEDMSGDEYEFRAVETHHYLRKDFDSPRRVDYVATSEATS